MPLNIASPGIVVREIDLTVGRINPSANLTAGIAAPFEKGPVNVPILISTEQDLLKTFGQPYSIDNHYESWYVASSYLSYGGNLRVVRVDDTQLVNASYPSGTKKITSIDNYVQNGYSENLISNIGVIARDPGSWGNNLKVAIIDGKADQVLSGISTNSVTSFVAAISNRTGTIVGSANTVAISTASITLGQEVNCDISGVVSAGTTVISIGTGVITISSSSLQASDVTTTFDFGTTTTITSGLQVGMGVTQPISSTIAGFGVTTVLDGYLKGMITEVGDSSISVKVLQHVSAAGTVTNVEYGPGGVYGFSNSGTVGVTSVSQSTKFGTSSYTSQSDWFDQQYITISDGSKIYWNTVADRPSTTNYTKSRSGRFDELHILVLDNTGSITGSSGNIIERHLNLSKASDAEYSLGSPSYWRKYLETNSNYIFGGSGSSLGITTISYSSGFVLSTSIASGWDQKATNTTFGACGSLSPSLSGGKNYDGSTGITTSGALSSDISKIAEGYDLISNGGDIKIDFLLMGSGFYAKEKAQSLANKLIQIADNRKDCLAFISPYRSSLLNDSTVGGATVYSSSEITNSLISYYDGIASSSYAIFDSGYKYVYDKYSDVFRYIPLNGDIAGLCARTDINSYPWFSPAGTSRGSISNAIKLVYNPSKIERDRLYSNRINPVVFSPGSGVTLFGDKTALGKPSAFDRINVRRLFIYLQKVISDAAKNQLFEFNDEITRNNFINIVEPFLRDIQAKRGIFDFRVICDESNNTASVIDNNEFLADIYVKPTRSINYIGLTFVATRTGVNFNEIIGTV